MYFVYGNNDKKQRKRSWDFLTSLALIRDAAWFVTGDFSDITCNADKTGGTERLETSFDDFRTFLSEGDLYDLQHEGDPLSWKGKRGTQTVRCRLDRALPNSTWAEEYPSGRCEYLRFEGSDHRPLVTYFDPLRRKKKSIFRYDRRLNHNEEVSKLVEDKWTEEVHLQVKLKIDKCRTAIILWSKKQQVCSKAHLERIKREIEEAMVAAKPDEILLKNLNTELTTAYKAEEEFWKQRSRQLWLNLGDKNTGFFHASTKSRKAMNKFSMLEGADGEPVYLEEEITSTIVNYFQNLFTATNEDHLFMSTTLSEAIQPCVSDEQNAYLIKLPLAAEIKEALFSINAGKAPGPDGFSSCFFQTNWNIVGPDIIKEVQEFFTSGCMLRTINETHVRLIPKGREAKKVLDYRPIALCNVYYKVISKILTRRLQPLLKNAIAETQSAFVPKRAISDNVLITHEVLHYLKTSKAQTHCSMAIKTDMSKAYDRLEWSFIQEVMKKLGFYPKWVNWIMQCITSVSYTFIVNGASRGFVKPGRGIRQRDPLSPYIFYSM